MQQTGFWHCWCLRSYDSRCWNSSYCCWSLDRSRCWWLHCQGMSCPHIQPVLLDILSLSYSYLQWTCSWITERSLMVSSRSVEFQLKRLDPSHLLSTSLTRFVFCMSWIVVTRSDLSTSYSSPGKMSVRKWLKIKDLLPNPPIKLVNTWSWRAERISWMFFIRTKSLLRTPALWKVSMIWNFCMATWKPSRSITE